MAKRDLGLVSYSSSDASDDDIESSTAESGPVRYITNPQKHGNIYLVAHKECLAGHYSL